MNDYSITKSLFCIITDNASNNIKMWHYIESIAQISNDFRYNSCENMISCSAHVLNLACQDLIKRGIKSEAPTSNDITPFHLEEELSETVNDRKPVNRLRLGCIKIR
jgi:hypothetical protein